MEDVFKDGSEVLETPEEVEAETTETSEEEVEVTPDERDEKIATLEREKADLLSKNKQLFERTKKAKEAPSDTSDQLSPSDSISLAAAIAKGTVEEEDIERVQKFAKDEGVSVREALKSDELKAILSIRVEKRSTANAANVSNVRRGPAKIGDDVLLSNAAKGKLPDSDEEIDRLIAAKSKQNR